MRSKKAQGAKTAKSPTRGRRIGLTSAIGPKATTAVVIVTLAGGLWYGSHQRLSAKTPTPVVETQTEFTAAPDPSSSPKKAPVAKAHDSTTGSAENTSAAAKSAKAPVTTLEGCLERNGDSFRLKETSGTDAPRARSWKSAFIKKSQAAVDLGPERVARARQPRGHARQRLGHARGPRDASPRNPSGRVELQRRSALVAGPR